MKNLFGYKHLALASVSLVLFLFFAVLLSSLFRRNTAPGGTAPTLIPTQYSNRPGGFEGEVLPTLSDNEQNGTTNTERKFSADQLKRLQRFNKDIPYYSEEFDIGYSKLLDKYFVQLKGAGSQEKFKEYLRSMGMLDIANVYRDFFVIGEDKVYNQIQDAEDAYLQTQQ